MQRITVNGRFQRGRSPMARPAASTERTAPVSRTCRRYDGSSIFWDTTDRVQSRRPAARRGIVLSATTPLARAGRGAVRQTAQEAAFATHDDLTGRGRMGMHEFDFANSNGWACQGPRDVDARTLGTRVADHLNHELTPTFLSRSFPEQGIPVRWPRAVQQPESHNPILGLGNRGWRLLENRPHTEAGLSALSGPRKQDGAASSFVCPGMGQHRSERRRRKARSRSNWAFFASCAKKDVATKGQPWMPTPLSGWGEAEPRSD